MRWKEQEVEREDEGRLPGVGDGGVVRTFDAPEAMGVNFHEVRARSILNHVPGSSFGFNWTINAFRGCTHSCVYCMDGETPVLMADGRTKPLGAVKPGDAIYGTVRRGPYRHYMTSEILAHWETESEAYRIFLEDGTSLIAGANHRFLTDRGWKYVTGSEQGALRRPHLTTNNKLMGMGALGRSPSHTSDYQRGYLCGMIRGDGTIGSYSYARPGRRKGDVHRFRLALADVDALKRSRDFLALNGVSTDEFAFSAATPSWRAVQAIRTQARDSVERIRHLVAWPRSASTDWGAGFLAGIFDAEGSYSVGVLRIANTDQQIIDWVSHCLSRSGFDYVIEKSKLSNGMQNVRLVGGLKSRLKFLQAVDPAITRKRAISPTAIKSDASLGVGEIEPLGKRTQMFDVTTSTGDFIADGVVSHNCFARRTHPYLGFGAGRDFEREIVVKVNAPEVVRAELARPGWGRELVAIGTNTDPYQWAESRYRFMPEILGALERHSTPVSVLTKSSLVMRDVQIYERMAKQLEISVNLSVPTLDEKAWRATEPHTPHPRKRLEAVAELRRRGIPSGVLVAPLMPGINDSPEQVEPIVELARQAGATFLGGVALHLRGEVRDVFFGWLKEKRPDLLPRYERLYANDRAYMTPLERKRTTRAVRGWGRPRSTGPARSETVGDAAPAGRSRQSTLF